MKRAPDRPSLEGREEFVRALGFWVPGLALSLYAVVLVVFWAESRWRPEWDSAIYLLTAASLESGEGYRYLGEPFFLRPPGLSWLLSFAARDGGFDFALLARASMLAGAAAVAALHVALLPTMGWARALTIALLTGLSPLFVARFNWVLSDLPFLALLFPALALLDRGAAGGRFATRAGLAGVLLLAAAAYLRTAALAALPGILLLYALRRSGRQRWLGLLPAVGVGVAIAPWLLHARQVASRATRPSEQLLLFDYRTALLRTDPGDPASSLLGLTQWGERISTNTVGVADAIASSVMGSGEPWAVTALVAMLCLGAIAAGRRGPDAIDGFALGYAGLLAIYFTQHPRLIVPLLPIVYRAAVEASDLVARCCTSRLFAAHRKRVAALATGLVVASLLAVELAQLPRRLDVDEQRLPAAQM